MRLTTGERCDNCEAPTPGAYCASCGQRNLSLHASVRALLGEAAEELFGADSRIGRTLFALFFRPGFLSREYRAGRRTRYTSPVKLYLAASALFFLFGWSRVGDGVMVNVHDDAAGPAARKLTLAEIRKKLSPLGRLGRLAADQLDRTASPDPVVAAEATRHYREAFATGLPRAFIVSLPVFALLLMGLYRKDRYYIDHLVFVVHAHAALFCWATIALWMGAGKLVLGWTSLAIVYSIMALHSMYGDGWLKTIAKAAAFVLLSLVLVCVVMLGLGLIEFLLF